MQHYRRVAVYPSVLYGEDFIVESLQSVLPHVDRAFVVMMQRPWGGTTGVQYKGEWVPWPEKFDETRERIAAMRDPRVEVVEAQKFSPWNRWGYGVNIVVRSLCEFDEVVVMDPDCVFAEDQAALAFAEWGEMPRCEGSTWASPRQVELWRSPEWMIERQRQMVFFIRGDLSTLNFPDPPGSGPVRHPPIRPLEAHVHNLGFCVSPKNMRWKHLCAMSFSPVVGESIPRPEWYEDVWLKWDTTNNRDLDISVGCEKAIPRAVLADTSKLPDSIWKRLVVDGEWSEFNFYSGG